jgi:hypothetical protein
MPAHVAAAHAEVPFWRSMAEVAMAFGVRVMARPDRHVRDTDCDE